MKNILPPNNYFTLWGFLKKRNRERKMGIFVGKMRIFGGKLGILTPIRLKPSGNTVVKT